MHSMTHMGHRRGWAAVLVLSILVSQFAFVSSVPAKTVISPDYGNEDIKPIGHLGGGNYDFWVVGDTLYTAYDRGVSAFDVSDPTNPVLVGDYLTGDAGYQACAATGTALFAHDMDGAQTWDVSDPTSITPTVKGTFGRAGYSGYDAEVDGDLLFMPDEYDGLHVLDISGAPEVVTEVQNLDGPGYYEYWWNCEAADGYLYASFNMQSIKVFDCNTLPATQIGELPIPGDGLPDLALDGDYLYSAGTNGPPSTFKVIDVSNPAAPAVVGNLALPNQTNRLAGANGYAYSLWLDELSVIDCTNPASPSMVATIGIEDYPAGVIAQDGRLYVLSDFGFRIYDISADGGSPSLLGEYNAPNYVTAMASGAGSAVYSLSGNTDRMWTADASDPTSLSVADIDGLPARGTGIASQGDMTAVLSTDWSNGGAFLTMFDVSDPLSPVPQATVDVNSWSFENVAISGQKGLLYGDQGLQVWDFSSLASPGAEGTVTALGPIYDIAVTPQYVYAAYGQSWSEYGIATVDVSDSNNPSVVSTVSVPGLTGDMGACPMGPLAVVGGRLYVYFYNEGVNVFDISTPSTPVYLGGEADRWSDRTDTFVVSGARLWAVPSNWGNLRLLEPSTETTEIVEVSSLAIDAETAVLSGGDLVVGGRPGLTVFGDFALPPDTDPPVITIGGITDAVTEGPVDVTIDTGDAATSTVTVNGVPTAERDFTLADPGIYEIEVWARDAAGNVATKGATVRILSTEREAGASRYGTSVELAESVFDSDITTVVVATGRNFPDALAGAPLAYAAGGPVLLVDGGSVPASVTAYIQRVGASAAYVLGGVGAVPDSAVAGLVAAGIPSGNIERIAGATRYETAALISAKLREVRGTGSQRCVVASGENFPDALAVSGFAARNGYPILLVQKAGVPAVTAAAIDAVDPSVTLLVGGSGVVPDSAAYTNPLRLAGANRYATAKAIAEHTLANGFSAEHLMLATGMNFPDALAAGPVCAALEAPMLLTNTTLPTEMRQLVEAHADEVVWVHVAGGSGAVPDSVVQQVLTAAGL